MQETIKSVPVLPEKSCKQHLNFACAKRRKGKILSISSCLPVVEGLPHKALIPPHGQLAHVAPGTSHRGINRGILIGGGGAGDPHAHRQSTVAPV